MPISRDEFERRQINVTIYIEQFLRAFADTAFSVDELVEFASKEGRSFPKDEVLSAVDALVTQGKTEREDVNGVVYYIHKRRSLGFGRGGG